MVTWRKEDAALGRALLDQLNALRSVDPSGRVSFTFSTFPLESPSGMLSDLLVWNDDVPSDIRQGLARESVFRAAALGPLTSDGYLRAVSQSQANYLAKPLTRYAVTGQVSVSDTETLRGAHIAACHISFPGAVSKATRHQWDKKTEWLTDGLHAPPPSSYRWVRASTRERSMEGALARAQGDITLLFGLWNFALNYGSLRMTMGPRRPVNEIVLGPFYLVQAATAPQVSEAWYEPDYVGAISPTRLGKKADRMTRWTRALRRALLRSSYRATVESWIRSYNGALDNPVFNTSYLLLWRALEAMTCTTNDPAKVTVRRASAVFAERDYHSNVLRHLGDFRNRIVHAGADMEAGETRLYGLKKYVETLLAFQVMNSSEFSSPQEAAEFLDLPASEDEIRRRLRLLRRAARYRAAGWAAEQSRSPEE